jgi:hypothetical protein
MHDVVHARIPCSTLVLAVLLAVPPTIGHAEVASQSPRERSQVLLTEGDEAVERGELEAAISAYEGSYAVMSEIDRASYLGSISVRKAMEAFDQRVAREQHPAARRDLLLRQSTLLARFLDEVRAREGGTEDVGAEVLAELEAKQAEIDQALRAGPHEAAGSSDAPEHAPTTALRPTPDEPSLEPPIRTEPDRDRLGLGLTIGGSALVATGLGVSAGWWVVRRGARANADGGGDAFAEGMPARADYLEHADAVARKYLVAGSIVAGVGLATMIGGIVHLAVHRRRADAGATALRVVPFSSPTTGGVVLHGRF